MESKGVVLVTGASRGIGEHLVHRFAERGYDVVGCSRNTEPKESKGVVMLQADVANEGAVKALLKQVRERFGRLDVLINNAGIASMNHSLLTPVSTFDSVFATNVRGTFLMSREAAKLMKGQGRGRIVNFSTVAVPLNLEGEAAYVASKSAVESLTRVLAAELASFGITVNAVGPTPIDTALIKGVPAEKIERLVSRQLIKRKGSFSDVENVIEFFLRPESDFVTGQVVYLGGIS